MSHEVMAACDNCIYFRPGARSKTKDGICRRNPPMPLMEDEPESTSSIEYPPGDDDHGPVVTLETVGTYHGWPDVMTHDWCGEWAWIGDVGVDGVKLGG